jgi:polysaccharide export outer membrane protein
MVSLPRLSLFALGAAAVALLCGCATDDVKGSNPVIPAATTTAQLRPGDSLTIALQGVPDPSTNTVQIDDQGLITLPFIGPHPAAGVSTADLSTRIRAAYLEKKIYTAVDVSVSVTERYVYVGGEVAKPGRIIWTPDLTVAKAVQAAGGFSLYAKEGKVTLVRDQKAYELNARLAQQNPAQDPRLMPGDSLQVPRSAF